MKSIGIIAEYNPFHNGHAHQLSFLKKQGADTVVVALSGCFVQRGTPAWTDKYLRTRMALQQGADFVFELPTLFALSSAEGFAFGGVSLLNALPLDGICFGSECGTLTPLETIADFLSRHDNTGDTVSSHTADTFHQKLQQQIKKGLSFPAAREQVLQDFFPELLSQNPGLLSSANNILAIEYLKAVKKLQSPLRAITLSRADAGYHSKNIDKRSKNASASAIRKSYADTSSLKNCRHTLPESVYDLLEKNPLHYPIELDDFSASIYLCLRQAEEPEDYTSYGDISPELARRMWNCLPEYTSATSFIERIKTKNITYNRISRGLIHLLLHITTEQLQQSQKGVPYLRLLGMRKEKSGFLRQINTLPVITKVADYPAVLTDFYLGQEHSTNAQKQSGLSYALDCFQTDLLAADIYRQTVFQKLGCLLPDEYRSGIQMI